MKKVLFATTALVATASVAAADVTWSGYGRFGLQYEEKDDGGFSRDGIVFTVGGTLGIVDLAFFAAQDDSDLYTALGTGKNTSYGLSGAIEVGAATQITGSVSDGDIGDTSYGLGVVHDLGGGVSILGMVGRSTAANNVADLGVKFNF